MIQTEALPSEHRERERERDNVVYWKTKSQMLGKL